jgi:hypothetical protein
MGAPAVRTAHPPSQIAVSGAPHISALRDATIAEADTDEALAAAAALWEVLFQHRGFSLVRGMAGSPQRAKPGI